jgi:hypothetical protein
MGANVNDLCGYKDFEMYAIIDNLVCLIIGETLPQWTLHESMMWTSWSCGHATQNQDWDLILKSRNRLIWVWQNGNMPQGTNIIGMK